MACCNCTPKTKSFTLIGIGSTLICLGLVLIFCWETIYVGIKISQLSLSPTSTSYKIWKEPPIPIYFEVYLYNITNSEEILKGDWSVKPNLTEHGPYVFLEKHRRVQEIWNDNKTISFSQIKTWEFLPNLTKGSLNDKITNLNVITATVGNLVKNKNIFVKMGVEWLFREEGETLLVTHTARELLFDGYEDKLLSLVSNLSIPGLNFPFTKFGWFYGRNGSATYDGSFEMWTGTDDLDKLGIMTKWNGKTNTRLFPSPCDGVQGTTGELWPPLGEHPNKTTKLFSPDMCSTITLDLNQEPTEQHGIEGVRYVGSRRSFDNGSLYPEQKCFAPNSANNYLPQGLRNSSACRFGAPAYLSFPHFYEADPQLLNSVIGLKPDPKKHRLEIHLEPATGLPLIIKARAQINLRTEKISGLSMFSKAQTRYWPMMWFTQKALLTEDLAVQLRTLLVLRHLGPYTGWGLVGLGFLFTAIGLAVFVNFLHRRNSDARPLVTS